ncbi:MAG: hypothetical protein K6A79_10390, partial [Ruminococcus sp.]|nr:hypothetical protein [Ruminococcus sp.]
MKELELQRFFPEQLEIKDIIYTSDKIIIKMKSHSESGVCPCCGVVRSSFHYCSFSYPLKWFLKSLIALICVRELPIPDSFSSERFDPKFLF